MYFSELELLLQFPYTQTQHNTIVDIGAHVGSFCKKFAQKQWRVIAFEPEPNNRQELKQNLEGYKDITIIPKAVSNQENQKVPFYVSSEHWGIHSLQPFHATHEPTLTVETVRLDKTLESLKISDISLLKIDIEGADFLALQSFDFKSIKPEIVMCEFSDERSFPNFGYTHHDVAKYMENKGYKVFVSEWAPIKEFGRKGETSEPHHFLQCAPYPLNHKPSWGNLIFVRQDRVDTFKEVLSKYLKSVYQKRDIEILEGSNQRLLKYKNKHKGERCVIIGNGPSLNKMDLSFLKHEICFGTNRIYLGFDKWDFRPTYYVSVNKLVLDQSADQIRELSCPKFLSDRGLCFLEPSENQIFIKTSNYKGDFFSTDPQQGIKEGNTVTYVALQIAYYMGFETVILIGVDHNFTTKGTPHKEVVSSSEDPNHFHPDYFGKGAKWNLPDLEGSEQHYKLANVYFKADNRKIIDATLDGKCTIFPKKHYKDVFKEYFSHFKDSLVLLEAQKKIKQRKYQIKGKLENNIYIDKTQKPTRGFTIFTIPKPFKGHIGTIQRNAIKSWISIFPESQIILFGDEEGIAEIASELGVHHISCIKRNEFGTPLLDDVFFQAQQIASYDIMVYANCDIIFTKDLPVAIHQVSEELKKYLMIGRCWNIDLKEHVDFQTTDWENYLQTLALQKGTLAHWNSKDYFIFPKPLFETIPQFAVGRGYWDTWMVRETLDNNIPLIDASEIVQVFHQNHSHHHIAGGKFEAYLGIESQNNKKAAGSKKEKKSGVGTIASSTLQLKSHYLKQFPKLSVIFPLQEEILQLQSSIEKVLAEFAFAPDSQDYEILVIDLGFHSSMSGLDFYKNRIRYVRQENKNLLEAYNLGVNLAFGEFIFFLNPEDTIFSGKLIQKLVAAEEESSTADIVLSGYQQIQNSTVQNIQPWQELEDFNEWTIWNLPKLWHPATMSVPLFRRKRLQQFGGFDLRLSPEAAKIELILRLILRGCRSVWLQQLTYQSYKIVNPLIKENPFQLSKNVEMIVDKYFSELPLSEWTKDLEKMVRYNILVWLGWVMYQNRNLKQMAHYLKQSYDYTPYLYIETKLNWIAQFHKFSKREGISLKDKNLIESNEWKQLDNSVFGFSGYQFKEKEDSSSINSTTTISPNSLLSNSDSLDAQPLISVIMPAHNAAATVREAIESVQKEALESWEIIVIDDGSKDNTSEIINEKKNSDSRIRLYKAFGEGPSIARNIGLAAARGKYIGFLDADDTYYNNALTKRVQALENNPDWHGVYCKAEVVNNELQSLDWQIGAYNRKLTFQDMHGSIHLNSLVAKASILQSQYFDVEIPNGEDWLYLSRVLRSGVEFHYLSNCSILYRMHPSGRSRRNPIQREINMLKVLDYIYGIDPGCTIIPATKFYWGLSKPDKELIALKRKVGLLISLLLSRQLEQFFDTFQESLSLPWDRLNRNQLKNTIKFATMRYYACSAKSWQLQLQKEKLYLEETLSNFQIDDFMPKFSKSLLEILD